MQTTTSEERKMLVRSSSTPILGSLLPSSSPIHHPNPTLQSICCHLSDSSDRDPHSSGFRRTRSDGNLHNLLPDNHHPSSVRCFSSRPPNPTLETIPSFAIYNSRGVEEEQEPMYGQQNPVTVGDFSFPGEIQDVGLDENEIGVANGKATPPLFLARGLGIDRLGSGLFNAGVAGDNIGGGGGDNHLVATDYSGGGGSDVEMLYKRMLEEDPTNALFLSNYAQFLYQCKGDLRRAEEYYSRAILAEPGDGEILSQYAKVTWELHHDEERASCYFEQAVKAAPEDSHVLAAYAGFLWETEDDDGLEDGESQDYAGDHGTY